MTTRRTAVDDLQRAATIPLILGVPLQSEHARPSPIERWSLFPLLLNLGDPVTSFGHGTSDVIQLPRSGLLFLPPDNSCRHERTLRLYH